MHEVAQGDTISVTYFNIAVKEILENCKIKKSFIQKMTQLTAYAKRYSSSWTKHNELRGGFEQHKQNRKK